MRGFIYLKHDGNIAASARYTSEPNKQKKIERWKKLYGPAFYRAEIVDDPDKIDPLWNGRDYKGDEKLRRKIVNTPKAVTPSIWADSDGLGGWRR